ncbi:alpha/beta hydrolase [Sphingomonas naphthae]|uniref:Alpha/beta hydrolase n=1 Tax=Sphingomonas naphthae TaxID=1813468 RepID=A0ABY7TG87_9SPHN|nr:alpha/beta hydrolase [Sphingomonas naphthae]WCT72243.1 alpha/beta hydrolase [Sphingomonas naphthae]
MSRPMTIRQHDDHVEIVPPPSAIAAFDPLVAQARRPVDTLPSVAEMRAGAIAFGRGPLARSAGEGGRAEDVDAAGLPSMWFHPPTASRGMVALYLHGGGYVCGSVAAQAGTAAAIAEALSMPLLALGYRQAPEHPYPQAGEDAWAGFRWLRARTDAPILLIGDSAGAYLALATAARAARAGTPAIGAIACSGWFDLAMRAASWEANEARDIVSMAMGRMFIGHYLADQISVPDGALLGDAELALLPPTLIQVGGHEMALDDSFDIAARARGLGREVALEVYAGMPHNFMKFAGPAGDCAVARIGEWAARLSA